MEFIHTRNINCLTRFSSRVAEGRERHGQLLLSREWNKKNLMEQVGVDYQAGRPWLSHAVSTVCSAQAPVHVPNSC